MGFRIGQTTIKIAQLGSDIAVYRSDDPESPVAGFIFDPFQSPWQPLSGQGMATTATETRGLDAPSVPAGAIPKDFKSAVQDFEKDLLARALAQHRHNQRATAKALGMTYDQLRHCLKKHGLLDQASA